MSRMTKISRLMMRGFKSFAHKTEIQFGDEFNCVLGPNGSGKSNVLDAVCFVLGKGSAKGLRVERASNLLYNGGKTKKAAKEGEVSIFFNNSDGTFPTEDKEVKVTRIIKASGQSTYKINDKTRTRQQILDLLSVARVNPDGYNIVLQGDIIRLVEMSPAERLKIIEEISGIGIYEDKKHKAELELAKVEERLKEAEIVLTERDTFLKELRRERNQALKYKELKEKIKDNKATHLNNQMEVKRGELAKVQKQIDDAESKSKKIDDEVAKLRNGIKENKDRIEEINREVEEKGEKEQVEIHKEVEALKVKIATDANRMKSLEGELAKVKQRREQLNQNFKELEDKISIQTKEKEAFVKRKQQKEKEIALLKGKIEQFKKKHKLDYQVEEVDKQVEELDKESDVKQKEIQEQREQQQELLREKDRLEYQIKSADEKIEKVLSVAKEHKKELEDLKGRKARFKTITLDLSKRLNEDSSLASQLATAKGKLVGLEEEHAKLRARDIGIKESIAGGTAVQKIVENKSRFKGVHGTISDLGEVQAKYSMALEVAAGPRLKSLVVDTDATAASCIKYLKDNKLGVATFLPLNKIKSPDIPAEAKKTAKAQGAHGLAIDLVKYDPQFKKAFLYVFGSTIVVDDIQVARRIGVGRIRMVTLDGDLVELSGAMVGGFRARKKEGSGFQVKEVANELEALEKKISDIRGVVKRLEGDKSDNEEMINKLREQKANLEGEIIRIEKGLHLESDDLEINRKLKKEFDENLESVEKKLREIQAKVTASNSELAKLKIRRGELRQKITELRNPRLVAELTTFEQKISELKEDIIKIDAEMKGIDTRIENIFAPEKENNERILKQLDKEEEDFRKEFAALEESAKSDKADLKEKEKKEKAFYEQFKELFTRRNKLSTQLQQLEAKMAAKSEEQKSYEISSRSVAIERARLAAELAAFEEEFKQYESATILKDKPEEVLKREISQFERLVENLGAVNMKALEIYEKAQEEYKTLLGKKETLGKEKEDVLVMMNEIESKKKELFMRTFNVLKDNFMTIFSQLTVKGNAELVLENEESPFDGGLRIRVRITGKKYLDIRSLSGGEKTLTALAFMFAVQEHDPAPFYFLDEVDAALDKRNSEKLAHYVRQYSKKAQYFVISHNDAVISEADNLYGVSMDEHTISKVVSLKI